jgi:membrane protease YdiL (CAAX protease family)
MSPDPMAPKDQDPARHLGTAAAVFYSLMAAGALLLMHATDVDARRVIFGPDDAHAGLPTAAAAAIGLAIVGLSHLARGTGAMRRLHAELSGLLGRPSDAAIVIVAATSAIGEELFFRGALQAWLGVWPTVVIFGLLHGGGVRRLWAWTLFATAGGVIFAGLTVWSQSLLPAVVMHFTVNYFNLFALTREPAAGGPA